MLFFSVADAVADRGGWFRHSSAKAILRFLGYAKNFRQTPVRRQLDYLRILGGSKEAAKELKLFGLKDFLAGTIYPPVRWHL